MQKITPCLWFEKELPSAIEYYKSIFKDNLKVVYLGDQETGPGGSYQFGTIELFGAKYDLLAAGPIFKFTEAISLTISCEDQEETDYYWNALTANGGMESMCGWCKDKYGLSWQIEPKRLRELSTSQDTEKRNRAMQAMFKMKKIIIADLEN
ncbi:VOC family protein [Candidatus Peregrinibacteria bacterium]|nr:VOC family protein [Candidatus Peregrinibacteria bacterium]